MYILGDIGNSETKIFLVNSKNKILKNINFPTKKINNKILKSKFKLLISDFKKIKKILFCSVVPKSFNLIKKFLFNISKKKFLVRFINLFLLYVTCFFKFENYCIFNINIYLGSS